MNQFEFERKEQLELLLADYSTNGLSEAQATELLQLLEEFPEYKVDHYDRAAAAFDVVCYNDEPTASVSKSLMDNLLADAEMFFDDGEADVRDTGSRSAAVPKAEPHAVDRPEIPRFDNSGVNWFAAAGWVAALAASVLLILEWRTPSDPVVASPSLAQRVSQLASLEDSIQIDWSEGKDPFANAVRGSVVWNQDLQEGYMRFAGMPVNDPSKSQYQLWIIDPDRDAEPIDGGVFDISSEQESIVAIDAKLRTVNPQAFAITIEKPGGVVVSDQEQLPLIAAVPTP